MRLEWKEGEKNGNYSFKEKGKGNIVFGMKSMTLESTGTKDNLRLKWIRGINVV